VEVLAPPALRATVLKKIQDGLLRWGV